MHAIRHGRLLQLLKSFSGEGQLHRIGFSQSIAERSRPSCHRGAINMQNALLKPHQLKLFLSNKFVYAQVVRQADGRIVAAASSIEKALSQRLPSTSNKDACSKCAALTRTRNQRPPARLPSAPPNPPAPARHRVGSELAHRAVQAGLDGVQWLRKPGQRHHGRIAALITAMQEGGLPLYTKSKTKAAG